MTKAAIGTLLLASGAILVGAGASHAAQAWGIAVGVVGLVLFPMGATVLHHLRVDSRPQSR